MDLQGRVYDIESYRVGWYYLDIDLQTGEKHSFEISRWKNDLYAFVKYMLDGKFGYQIGYNNLYYDAQVLQYILNRYEKWFDKTSSEINNLIFTFSKRVIDDINHELFPPFRERELLLPQIDLMKVHHFDNENRRCSLKWLQYMMNWENLEVAPYEFDEEINQEQWQEVKWYCNNDVMSTRRWWDFTVGEVEHSFYKGNNKIQDRLDLINDNLLPPEAISYSDSKIGDELNKRTYCKLTDVSLWDLYTLKKNRKPTKPFTYGQCIPKYVNFKTPELQAFKKKVTGERVSLLKSDDQEYRIKFRGMTYLIKRGGIHSNEAHRVIFTRDGEKTTDADVGAQYPSSILKRGLYPQHLGSEWTEVGRLNLSKKDECKQGGFKGREKMWKLALNSGYFGKTNEMTNWQYGPEVAFFCTIGNQFEILMLIEMLELNGIKCISANTDGIVCLYPNDKEEVYIQTCHEWEAIVGNTVLGKLEFTQFKKLWQESINHYVAIKEDGTAKIKGRFEVEGELHKNNSDKVSRIERKAIVEFVRHGTPVGSYIKSSDNIWDFCIGKKVSRNYNWQLYDDDYSEPEQYSRLLRFYISNSGDRLIKKAVEGSEAKKDMEKHFKDFKVTVFNKYEQKPMEDYNINYDYYINNAESIIRSVEEHRNNKNYKEPPKEQLNLFL
jgi:hypothetical protein